MVGVPKSTGCATCRKRKKKCGEERPSCRACITAGWKCPGYDKTWKFVDENKQLIATYRKKRYVIEEGWEGNEPDYKSLTWISMQQPYGGDGPEASEEHQAGSDGRSPTGIIVPPLSESDRSGSMLIRIMTNPRSLALFSLQSLGSFFDFIPSRLGRNAALDASVSCLCSIYSDFLTIQATTSAKSITRYAESLSALQSCVKDARLRTESETICASIILQLCELMTAADNGRWNNLCLGSSMLIRESGAARFCGGFERAMLESQRPMFIMQDFHHGQECFLADPEWRELVMQTPAETDNNPPSVALKRRLCDYLVDLPGLMTETAALVTAPNGVPQTDSAVGLRSRLAQMRLEAEELYNLEVQPYLFVELAELDENSYPPTSGADILRHILDCVLSSVLASLDRMIYQLDNLTDGRMTRTDTAGAFLYEYWKRREAAERAFAIVRSQSKIAAKPLEFGLQQMWPVDEVLGITGGA